MTKKVKGVEKGSKKTDDGAQPPPPAISVTPLLVLVLACKDTRKNIMKNPPKGKAAQLKQSEKGNRRQGHSEQNVNPKRNRDCIYYAETWCDIYRFQVKDKLKLLMQIAYG
ncbi:hypothetical protein CRG98_034819 [Punica granatum]|uniref:Uncharacterized protein n=1 Tax=Punica granatum TaxID=22663 RepID=A0A2I0ILJ9_PUNGR|nr:hypothetical protein CRG98_034819 [Punica granatum]